MFSYNKLFIIFILLINCFCYSQTPSNGGNMASIKSELPTITPASSTVANLMKFEEVPVNNYTGIPDVSIPIYSLPTQSKEVSIDLSLKYHPLSIQKDEFASYTGLGWSLIAGGSISRTVRGFPDEIIKYGSAGNGEETNGGDKTRIGIYNDHLAVNFTNKFYQVMNLFGNVSTPAEKSLVGNYCWNAFEKGIFDSDHDIYQFNFMGKSGRFFIKKNQVTGILECVNLFNDQSIKIEVNYTFTDDRYTFDGFTIYDDKGFKYVFEVKEVTTENSISSSESFKNGIPGANSSPSMVYTSAFHISKVYDTNNRELLTFSYINSQEVTTRYTRMSNRIMPFSYESTIINYLNGVNATARVDGILPKQTNTNKTTNIQTKKLAQIIITNKGKIDFTNESGREDTNMSSGSKLKKIEIKDHLNNLIKEFNFNYDYLNYTPLQGAVKKRLLLSEVIEKPSVGTEQLKHKFSYKNKSVHETYVLFDKWGYPTNSGMYTPDPTYYDATGVLQKVTYPTGGCAIYDFGSNTYSYIGSESITDFSSNPENWIFSTQYKGPISSSSNLSTKEISLGINLNTVKYLKYSFVMSGLPDDGFISLKRKNLNGTFSNVDFVDSEWIILPGYEHVILFSWLNNSYSGTLSLTLNYRSVKSNPLQYLKGGGVRINRIGYFDIDVEQDYYQNFSYYSNSNIIPSKEKNFDYNFFNTSKTSGSLVFPVPLYSYEVSHPAKSPDLFLTNLNYLTTTDYNNLQTVRTHGSDVGYKNVTVSEKDNGKTEFTYRTPIDYPEDHYTTSYPFIPSINRDYKRGQAVKETQYMKKNTTFFPISETDYVYEIDSLTVVTGIRGNNVSKCPKASEFTYYSEFIHCLNTPGCDHSWAFCNADYFLSFHTIFDSYGWSRLVSKTRKEFFYEPSQKVMQSSEFYTYNILNKKVSSHTVVNTTNDQIKTDYFYHVGNSFYTKNRVSEISHIHSYKNSELISVDKIIYSNAFLNNTSFLPEKIEKSKGSNALETKIRYNRYDEYGNVLEVQQENGMKISYIWGYSHTQPVAKIENMAYASIPTQLITNIHTANTETLLQAALTALRTNLTTAMVTTYTYIPLVGISTVTDPKGYRTTYTYDNFGRLATVKDADGKLLTTHQYNYRP